MINSVFSVRRHVGVEESCQQLAQFMFDYTKLNRFKIISSPSNLVSGDSGSFRGTGLSVFQIFLTGRTLEFTTDRFLISLTLILSFTGSGASAEENISGLRGQCTDHVGECLQQDDLPKADI